MTKRWALAVCLLMLPLLLAPAAGAAPGWTPATTLAAPANAFQGQLELHYQDGGIATEAYLEVQSLSPVSTVAHVGVQTPGGSYADQLTIPTTAEAFPSEPEIAVAPDGAAVAAWPEVVGSNPSTAPLRYRAAYRPAESSVWEAPVTIASDSVRVAGETPALVPVIGADGTAAVGVQHDTGETGVSRGEHLNRVDVAVHPAGGGWQAPVKISPSGESAEDLSLALDGHGDLSAAFTLRFNEGSTAGTGDDKYTVTVRRLPALGSVWGPVENITGSEISSTAEALHLAEDEAGDAVLTFQYTHSGSSLVWGVTRQGPNGSWTTPAALVTTSGSSIPEAAGVAPDGMAYILYSLDPSVSAEDCEGAIRAPAGGMFTAPRCVSPADESTFSGSMAFIGEDAYFVWRSSVPGESGNASVQGSRWGDGAALPDVAADLDLTGVPYGLPTLIEDHDGGVVALYDNQSNQLREAAYDAGPPNLLGASVPATAVAGQPVSFSATWFDLWSGLGGGQPTWSFGDGSAPVSGAVATHTFASPGTYTITLGAADARANATTSTSTIVVSTATAAPSPKPAPPKVTLTQPKCPKHSSKKACKRHRETAAAWQSLAGTVVASGGVASVDVDVFSLHRGHYEDLAGGHFRRTTKAKAMSAFVSARLSGSGHWSLRLPKLKPGSYTVRVRATDRAGSTSAILTVAVRVR